MFFFFYQESIKHYYIVIRIQKLLQLRNWIKFITIIRVVEYLEVPLSQRSSIRTIFVLLEVLIDLEKC